MDKRHAAIAAGLLLAGCTNAADPGGGDNLDAGVMVGSDAGSGSDATPGSDAAVRGNGHWVLGYYTGYQIDQLPIADIDWAALTDIAFAPVTVNGDGSLDLSFEDTHGTGVADAQALAAAAHAHGVHALMMLGGENSGANIATAAGSANRAAFEQTLLAAVDQLGFDGIDLDWEDHVELDDLVSLAQELRALRPSIELTYPGLPINSNYQTVDARFATLAASLDQLNLQTYYPATADVGLGWSSWFSSPLSGSASSTPIAIDDSLARYAAAGVPAAKLGMGTAFYAICYTGGISGPRQATTASTQIVGYGDYPLSDFYAAGGTFATNPAAIARDASAKEPYLTFASPITDAHCGQPSQYISYEDEQAIADKGAFAKAHGYGGIIVWTLQDGYLPASAAGGRSRTALLDALGTAFLQ